MGSTVWLLLRAVVEISSRSARNRGIPMGTRGDAADGYMGQGTTGVELGRNMSKHEVH